MMTTALFSSTIWVMLTCLPTESWASDGDLAKNPIVISYLLDGERVRKIVILRQDGSRSEEKWRGRLVGDTVQLVEQGNNSRSTLTFDGPERPNDHVVLNRHFFTTLFSSERTYNCQALTAERTRA